MFTTLYCPSVSRSFTLQLCDNGLFAFNCIPWLCDCCSAGDLVSFTDILVQLDIDPVAEDGASAAPPGSQAGTDSNKMAAESTPAETAPPVDDGAEKCE